MMSDATDVALDRHGHQEAVLAPPEAVMPSGGQALGLNNQGSHRVSVPMSGESGSEKECLNQPKSSTQMVKRERSRSPKRQAGTTSLSSASLVTAVNLRDKLVEAIAWQSIERMRGLIRQGGHTK